MLWTGTRNIFLWCFTKTSIKWLGNRHCWLFCLYRDYFFFKLEISLLLLLSERNGRFECIEIVFLRHGAFNQEFKVLIQFIPVLKCVYWNALFRMKNISQKRITKYFILWQRTRSVECTLLLATGWTLDGKSIRAHIGTYKTSAGVCRRYWDRPFRTRWRPPLCHIFQGMVVLAGLRRLQPVKWPLQAAYKVVVLASCKC